MIKIGTIRRASTAIILTIGLFLGFINFYGCSSEKPKSKGGAAGLSGSENNDPSGTGGDDEQQTGDEQSGDGTVGDGDKSGEGSGSRQEISATESLQLREGETGLITIDLPKALATDLQLTWTLQPVVEGDGAADFNPGKGSVTIKAGNTSVEIDVVSIRDDKAESTENQEERHLMVAKSGDGAYKVKSLIKLLDGEAPEPPITATAFSSIGGAGEDHTCMIKGGKAFCFGANGIGEMGDGTDALRFRPNPVLLLVDKVTSLATGFNHNCAVMNGGVWCWGSGGSGQMGDGTLNSRRTPVAVASLATDATAVAAGDTFSCAVKGGAVFCFGNNAQGQLGTGNINGSATPVAAQVVASDVTAIAAGAAHTCAVKAGALYCWGQNTGGQLGTGNTNGLLVPTLVPGMESGVTHVAAQAANTCAIKSKALYCWGRNNDGQVGNGTTTAFYAGPRLVRDKGVTDVKVGATHACAVIDNKVHCWGSNAGGQVGNNSMVSQLAPVAINGLDTTILGMALGARHTCVLGKTASHCWGLGAGGRLGTGDGNNRQVPTTTVYP